MYEISHYLDENKNDLYQYWLDGLCDRIAKIAVIKRVARFEAGLFGDCKSLRDGIGEMRIDVGAGLALLPAGWQSGDIAHQWWRQEVAEQRY